MHGPVGKAVISFAWTWGLDHEYDYSVVVHEDGVVWHLQMDAQWSPEPVTIVQTLAAARAGNPITSPGAHEKDDDVRAAVAALLAVR